MPPKNRLTLLFPGGIGPASKFSKASRPLVRVNTGSLHDGELVLQLTLQHLILIRRMSREMGHDTYAGLFKDSKSQYDE